MTIPIKEIKLHLVDMTLNNPFTTSFGTVQEKEFYIIEVIDDQGIHGFGESVAFSSPWYTEETVQTNFHMIHDFLIDLLRKNPITHPDDISKLFAPIKRNNMAKAALETAIWDLYAKREGIPLSQAIGGTKGKIQAGISLGIQKDTTTLLQMITHYVDAGYKRVKVKIKPGTDLQVLQAIRTSFPDLPLMVDANSAYTLNDIEHLKQFDQFNLMMIEQPLAHDDIINHARLQSALETPICLDESIHSFDDAKNAIQLGSCKIINIKIGRVGGLSEAIRIHDYCETHHIPVWCGGMLESGIGRAHNIALASLNNFSLPGDIGSSSHYWKRDIIDPEVVVHQGEITIPDQAGIGYHLNKDLLNKVTREVTSFQF